LVRVRKRIPIVIAFAALFLSAMATLSWAQSGSMSPYQGEEDGVNAGGKWMQFESEDKMTGAKRVRFELLANNYFREDPEYKPRIEIFCENGKFKLGDFNPGVRLGPPNRPGFWGQPQMEVRVSINDYHANHGWNWVRGHFLSMDKGTVRGLIGAELFNVELQTRSGRQIAEFSPEGLDRQSIREACDLTPSKPSND